MRMSTVAPGPHRGERSDSDPRLPLSGSPDQCQLPDAALAVWVAAQPGNKGLRAEQIRLCLVQLPLQATHVALLSSSRICKAGRVGSQSPASLGVPFHRVQAPKDLSVLPPRVWDLEPQWGDVLSSINGFNPKIQERPRSFKKGRTLTAKPKFSPGALGECTPHPGTGVGGLEG